MRPLLFYLSGPFLADRRVHGWTLGFRFFVFSRLIRPFSFLPLSGGGRLGLKRLDTTTGQKDVFPGAWVRLRDRQDLRTGQQEAPRLQDGI